MATAASAILINLLIKTPSLLVFYLV